MTCQYCGAACVGGATSCGVCGRTLPGPARAAAGVLTPPRAPTLPTAVDGPPETAPIAPLSTAFVAGAPLSPGHTFGRYHIISLLGEGGMGAVYQGWDEELGVAVAIKVIRFASGSQPGSVAEIQNRFKRELLLSRQVTHRNVVRIHDMGEIDGIKYITMPFIDGEDLARIRHREGTLAVPRVLRLARQIASGLVAAHEAGVVHRDLKPANIMVESGGEALIMDFGIARADRAAGREMAIATAGTAMSAGPGLAATRVGSVVGTIEYMAPEQARAQPVDQRADIYAFGLILYDLLVRNRLSDSSAAFEELKGRLDHAPPPPRSLDPTIPQSLDRIIMRCVQPAPADRYQTSRELLADLNRLDDDGVPLPLPRTVGRRAISAAAAFMLALVAGTWWFVRPQPVPQQPPPMSLLIADFENRTSDPVFDGALEQAMGIALEGAPFITVYPRRDAARVGAQIRPGAPLDSELARLISVREGVKTLIAGTISHDDRSYRLAVRAIDPVTSAVLATAEESASEKDAVLRAVAAAAADLRQVLGDTQSEVARLADAETFTTSSLEALRAYSTAQDLAANGRYAESIEHYRTATEADAKFGRAFAGWATSTYRMGREAEAEELYQRAFSLMDRMTEREKYRTLGGYYVGIARDYIKAIENFETLVRLYPADGAGRNNLALAYFNTLDFQKALEEARRVLDIYPSLLLYRSNYALYAMYAGDFATAATEAARVLEQNPSYAVAYLPLAAGAIERKDFDAARSAYEGMARASAAGASRASLGLADLAMYRGRFADALRVLADGIRTDERGGNQAALAIKYALRAEAHLALAQQPPAIAAARSALALTRQESAAVPAARVLIRTGRIDEGQAVATDLLNRFQPHSRAYGELLQADILAGEGRAVDAVDALRRGQKLADVWLGRLVLGAIFTEAGRAPEAISDLDLGAKRRGEASAAFLDDMPTFRYRALHLYWLARAQESVGLASAAEATRAELRDLAPALVGAATAVHPWLRLPGRATR